VRTDLADVGEVSIAHPVSLDRLPPHACHSVQREISIAGPRELFISGAITVEKEVATLKTASQTGPS